MSPKDEMCTAKTVQYRESICAPTTTDQGSPDRPPSRPNPPICPNDHEIRKYDTIHPIIGGGFGDKGRETYVSCLQRGFGVDMARRVVAWELENPQVGDGLAPTDRYLARNMIPWDTKLPRPNPTPSVVQLRPCPSSSSAEPPPKYRYPASTYPYVAGKISSHPPLRKMKKLNLRSWTTSPPPRPSCEVLDPYFTRIENVDVNRHLPVSYFTETFRRDERNAQEAKEKLEQKWKEQKKDKAKQEKATKVIRSMEDVPDYIKDLARKWREKYPGPNKLFRKDFNFGPRAQIDEDDDYRRPLSPCSSPSLVPDVSPEFHSKSLKRQRHDSSNTHIARESPHDRLQAVSSSTPSPRSVTTVQPSRSSIKSAGGSEAHSDQLVRHNPIAEPRFEIQRSDAGTMISDFNLSNFADGLEFRASSQEDKWATNRSKVVNRDSCCGKELEHHLDIVFNQRGKLENTANEARAAVDEAVGLKTCGIQSMARTMRDDPPDLFRPLLRFRPAEPQTTGWSMPSNDRTRTLPHTSTVEHCERRKSYVPKYRSTEIFLRDIHESRRLRQLMREAKQDHRAQENTQDPRSRKVEDEWLGSDPL